LAKGKEVPRGQGVGEREGRMDADGGGELQVQNRWAGGWS
jgi:hypothetical protein